MNNVARAELLRVRFATLFPVAVKPQPKAKKPRRIWTPSRGFKTPGIGEPGQGIGAKRPEWVEAADPKPKPTVATKHRKGVPALTAIAAKQPKKLVRAYRDADSLLAERARR